MHNSHEHDHHDCDHDHGCDHDHDHEHHHEHHDGCCDVQEPFVRQQAKVGRNDPCPCNSGKKYKKCCLVPFR